MRAFRVPRDFVRVHGPDASSYLHGQLSQEVASLGVGDLAWSFLLEPTGKTVAWLRVTRVGEDEFVLDTDPGIGDAVRARLERFKLRTKADLEPLEWSMVALRSEPRLVGLPVSQVGVDVAGDGRVVAIHQPWPGSGPSLDLLGPSVEVPEGIEEGSAEEYEALRIAAGVPITGVDLAIDGIPNEAGPWVIGASVSFTKGCYTGQELVMRIDSRGGNVPHPLRLLELADGSRPPAGADVVVDGRSVGHLTSVGGGKALAGIGRAVEPGSTVVVRWDGGEVPATVRELPTG